MKRFLALALTATLTLSLLSGCGSNNDPAPAAPAPAAEDSGSSTTVDPAPEANVEAEAPPADLSGKITFSLWDLNTMGYFEEVRDAFNKSYPNIEVEFVDNASADYTQNLAIALNGGAAADVILIKDADTLVSLQQKGQLEDLASYIQASGVNLADYNGLAAPLNVGGQQVGLPFRTDYYVNFFNKDIFDDAGLPYPSNDMTWFEYEELAKKLTSGSGVDKIYGSHFHTWQALVQNWGVQDGKNTILGPDYDFMRPAYEMALRMQDDDKTMMDFATLRSANLHYSGLFQQGTIAMMPMGTWYIATMIARVEEGETDVNWGVATIPHPTGIQAGNTVGSITAMSINAASSNKDLAWAWLSFCAGEVGADIISAFGVFPGRVNEAYIAKITSLDGMPAGLADALEVKNISLDRPIAPFVNEVNQMLGEEHGLLMLGEVSLDEFITTITERSAEIQD